MTLSSGRRRSQGRPLASEHEQSSRVAIIGVVIIVIVVLVMVGVLLENGLTAQNPDFSLTLQLGGAPKAQDTLPRNFRLWTVRTDGSLRFQTAYFPLNGTNSPASEVVTVAGPLVNSPQDIVSTAYFGAINLTAAINPGPGADANRFYERFSIERDPAGNSYGVNVLTTKPPYINLDQDDPTLLNLAMGAPPQSYYLQMIWAVALPQGTQVLNSAYPLPQKDTSGQAKPELMLRPYRRVTLDGWTVYYFDATSLQNLQTIRIRYKLPKGSAAAADPDFWKADRFR